MKKRRFLVIFNLFFIFGVAAGYLKTLSPLFLLPCVAVLSVFFYIAIKKNTDISSATLLCLMFLTGFFVFSIHNNAFENKYSSLVMADNDVLVSFQPCFLNLKIVSDSFTLSPVITLFLVIPE